MEKKTQRLFYIDILKAIGLFAVILAHFNIPGWMFQSRNFDVPLLVMVSGMLAAKTYRDGNILKYYRKRAFRLLVPAWIFLVIFFAVQSVLYGRPSLYDIIKGFLFQTDAGLVSMVWVIWVYFICALIIPIISKLKFNYIVNLMWLAIFIVFEIICGKTGLKDYRILYYTFFTIIPYGFISYIGYHYDYMSKKNKICLLSVMALIFLIIGSVLAIRTGSFQYTSNYKYPARIYYISYAIALSIIIIEIVKRVFINRKNGLVEFISKSSLWIYLWHILIRYIVKVLIGNDDLWPVQYLITMIVSIAVTFIQNVVVDHISERMKWSWLKVFKG